MIKRVLTFASVNNVLFMPIYCSFRYFPSIFFTILSMFINFFRVFVSGTAGCVATVLHDAIMNPTEGKGNILQYNPIASNYCIRTAFLLFSHVTKSCHTEVSVIKHTGATPLPTIFTCCP